MLQRRDFFGRHFRQGGRRPEDRLDAIFLSTHKFVGGPQGSGVLVANRELFRTRVPERPGGGTVDYVMPPADMPWGNRSMLLRDPDGNVINIFARPKAA